MAYEMVIGLEVHTELATKTKIFCSCPTQFGGEPNTHVCEVCSGMPGTLPVLNKKVVEYAIRTGLATHCNITRLNKFDRKNYFYPDLPKAYQISQLYLPICTEGYVELTGGKKIRIKEIHMEEDAGKLLHDATPDGTLADYNRCGVPLLEIVSEPDFRSAEEVVDYIEKLRAILQFTGVSDCKMQEGSLRADINLSVREKGSDTLGVRTEMKNMNSLRAIARAINSEFERQAEILEDGGKVVQETRRWDDAKGESSGMRSKEDAQDYKYFPEPDLPPIVITDEQIEAIRAQMPELPEDKKRRYMEDLGLPEYDTGILTGSVALVELFETVSELCGDAKTTSNFIMGDVMRLLKDAGKQPEEMDFDPAALATLIQLLNGKKISRQTARKVFEKVFSDHIDPEQYIKENKLEIVTDTGAIKPVVEKVIAANEKSVNEYKGGKTQALQYLIGQCMRELRGQAPAQEVTKMLRELLDN
ncbi:MAG: Asp-tRNA(Asn)/Glu-tRNA(Gln) amidotransferase subunit GatB [Clostridia bacterium]